MSDIPATMNALQLSAYEGLDALELTQKEVPKPRRGQVLVRVEAAAVNPSDLMFIRNLYGFSKPLPTVPGFEASGVVVAGEGMWARWLVGKRVACGVQQKGDGTWAQYVLVDATMCLPLLRRVTLEQGAMLLVNPFTAWGLLERARRGEHRAVVQSAAASALGRMVLQLAKRFKLPMIHVVRRDEQVELLKGLGAEHVLNSSDATFDDALREACGRLGATLAFDAVAGDMPQRLLNAMPRGGKVLVYGALSEEPVRLDPRGLIFEDHRVEGFWLSDYLQNLALPNFLLRTVRVQRALATDLRADIRARYPLEEAVEGMRRYEREMTGGKILLTPNA